MRLGANTVEQPYGKHLHAWAERCDLPTEGKGLGKTPKTRGKVWGSTIYLFSRQWKIWRAWSCFDYWAVDHQSVNCKTLRISAENWTITMARYWSEERGTSSQSTTEGRETPCTPAAVEKSLQKSCSWRMCPMRQWSFSAIQRPVPRTSSPVLLHVSCVFPAKNQQHA
jgi:hypothetical protein